MDGPWLRIDDRLLHGQVLVAWAAALQPDCIVLASDVVAGDPQRRAVYAALPHDDYEIRVETLAQAAQTLAGRRQRVLVVCGSPADAHRLAELGAPFRHVNVGGLHQGENKRPLLAYVYLSREDAAALLALRTRGVEVEARDLPASRGVHLDATALASLWD